MIHGVGTDLLKLHRLRPEILAETDPFLLRSFTEGERREAKEQDDRQSYLAGRFAGKEAVFKALRRSGKGIDLSEIEILYDDNGTPAVTLRGPLQEWAAAAGVTSVHLSLSHEEGEVLAFAVAERENNGI